MRAKLVMLALWLAAAPAAADSKTKELARSYEKELAACEMRLHGIERVTAGTQALVDDGQRQYEADLAALRTGLTEMQAYDAELTATLQILNADPGAPYRSLERKLDEQDNKIRKLRQTTKKVLENLAPVTARMIPRINARTGTPAPVVKHVHIQFASGRAIDAPLLTGTYRTLGTDATDAVEYGEGKDSAKVTTKLIANATCEQQRQTIAADATDVPASGAVQSLGLAWYVGTARSGRRLRAACRATKAGAVLATIDEPAGVSGWPELEPVLAAMVAARP
ncbi:MAG TPA: hypothetical protein VF516_37570 [Kofleriaceae bacterium]